MTAREVVRRIKNLGGAEVRQRGSHVRMVCACGRNHTTVPVHAGEDIKPGTLRGIERDLESCGRFGRGWLR